MSLSYKPIVWTAADVGSVLGCEALSETPLCFSSIEFVSGCCDVGSLYAPLKRQKNLEDYVKYYNRAFNNGAVAALTDQAEVVAALNAPVFLVDNIIGAMAKLATARRDNFSGHMVGVTGSVGKTTTKEMLGTILSAWRPTYVGRGNFNTATGLQSALASLPMKADAAVLEVSTFEPGAIARRAAFVRPTVGVVTNIGLSHAANFESLDQLVEEKLSLLDSVVSGGVGVVTEEVVQVDDKKRLKKKSHLDRLYTVGVGAKADFRVSAVEASAYETKAILSVKKERIPFVIPVGGAHLVQNASVSLAVAHILGIPFEMAVRALSLYRPYKRRNERWSITLPGRRQIELIDDGFNAAPKSVEAMLDAIALRAGTKRKFLILGDMLDLGPDSEKCHEALCPAIRRAGITALVTVGEQTKKVFEMLRQEMDALHFDNAEDARSKINALLLNGDLVAVKGSNGMALDKVVSHIKASGRSQLANPYWGIEKATAKA